MKTLRPNQEACYKKAALLPIDWSRPWTDAEILKEIGLPEDFLGS